VIDIDADDHENPFCCAEYAEEIYRYLRIREVQCLTCSPQQARLGIESFSIFSGDLSGPGQLYEVSQRNQHENANYPGRLASKRP
jgi:hypothetical protein